MIYSIGERESKRITSIRATCVILIIYLHQYAGDLVDAEFTISGAISGNTICNSIQYIISRIITI